MTETRTLDRWKRSPILGRYPAQRLSRTTRLLAVATVFAALPATAEEATRIEAGGLRIAILDLAQLPDLAPPPSAAETRHTAWRTSFGAERQTEPPVVKVIAGEGSLKSLAGIDAVLIQGVRAAAPLRRLFPPRSWRLIVSRRIIATDDPLAYRTNKAELPAATAIAIRAHESLRVTARTLALPLDDPAAPPSAASLPAAATAVRLVDTRGRALWLASVALPPVCGDGASACPPRQSLDTWRATRRQSGEPTVIGGRLAGAPAATVKAAPTACSDHGIDSDLKSQSLPPQADGNSSDSSKGCISIIQLGD